MSDVWWKFSTAVAAEFASGTVFYVGMAVRGEAQLTTAVVKTAVLDPIGGVRGGIVVLRKWAAG